MREDAWTRWIIQTARSWKDIAEVVKQTGVEFVDHEHRLLIENALELNRLIDAFEDNSIDLDTIKQEAVLLQRLRDVTAAHFAREEQFISDHGLRHLERQKEQHRLFVGMIDQYIRDFQDGKLWVSLQLKMAVLQWVVNHINHVDFDTFCIENWVSTVLEAAVSWKDVADVIKPIGLYQFDQEHRDLVTLTLNFNSLATQYEQQGDSPDIRNKITTLLKRVQQYAHGHFQHEEFFLKKLQVFNYRDQVESHRQFLSILRDLEHSVQAGKNVSPQEAKRLIMNWWVAHINRADFESFRMEQWTDQLLIQSASWDHLSDLIRSTGLDKIDQEHMDLIMLTLEANEVVDASQQGRMDAKLKEEGVRILHHLQEFSAAHFQGEEAFIQTHDIPGYETQHQQHQAYLEMISTLINDMASGRMIFSTRIKAQILSWWMHHINEVDYKTFNIQKWASNLIAHSKNLRELSSLIKTTEVDWVDRDHHHLVEMTLTLCNQLEHHLPEAKQGLREVWNFSQEHFKREEAWFAKQGLCGIEAHQDQHHDFLQTLEEMILDPLIFTPEGFQKFRLWMVQWWILHVNESDFQAFRRLEKMSQGGGVKP
ncbi:MAG: hemerythrin family protein [Magnetococcus sp. YQC-5]